VTVDGNVLERRGERWTIGRAGDVVVVGNWRCDGNVTPAVLRPSNGRIWVFTDWPAGATPVAGRPLTTVPGATTARVRTSGDCDRLEVLDADGQTTSVG
jgi:hypothetical protein